ncbi:MOSC domain-containing protein [Ornithinimicrobium tianjinense]|uniref:Molybdenum cofactor biosysynthesis protein n=1 Tax=Ornithinimicrobium tianjinense TaxID=1195761 RepID=A0A917BMZ5_9MICO|nr:MOSC domain-containing protein [Ornithinimicrobium tianjinense]GGF49250.1 molybdenum cofactor biosysynthesis protein [Ornithinimicrobium tianjinense]
MRITELRVYPVKSFAGDPVEEAVVEPWGLQGDRRWGLVDDAGEKVTARAVRAMLGLRAEQVDEETVRIHDRHGGSILVDTPLGLPPVPVSHSRQGFAAPADADVSRWISERLGRPVRLVWQEDPTVRRVSGAHGGLEGDVLSLADAGPLLLTSETSLARLQEWVGTGPELDMVRFRPNVVIDGAEAFAEDTWRTVRLGEVDFRVTEVCDRCVMTTVDPVTLEGGPEPVATLARHRRWEGKTWFGVRLVPLGEGVLRTGDGVMPQ